MSTPQQRIAVEDLRGDEVTDFGKVAYIICEDDGVDVVFYGDDGCFHFDYGTLLAISTEA